MIDKNKIPKEFLPYLIEIADRLWAGHAAIMIGAGFSKNAQKNSLTKKKFPSWNELGDVFYEKIYGIPPQKNDKLYLNVSKLAGEVQAAFGRSTLDQIIKSEIPDKEYQPSILHKKTLALPWTDVFTTNYDTLLERSAEKILQYRYETVINKEDLVFSTKPRIIKLHGSFPSERPFIITEEDYRKYPIDYAPFVNTVQQSLLENTLCLVGFSGDDPNFLKWIGWIRDNLGKENSPKIFLIGILSLSIGQKRLLEEQNIISIDLSSCANIERNHEKALTLFVDFLAEQGTVKDKLNWPEKNNFYSGNDNIPEIIEKWRTQRNNYPNWIIVPDDRRNILFIYTEQNTSLVSNISKISAPINIEFLYEFDWRLKMSLMPIYNNLIEQYEILIESYNPYPDVFNVPNVLTPISHPKFNWKEISQYWLELQLSMMRFYREEGWHEKWEKIVDKLGKIIYYYSSENIANFHYERCLYYLFSLDIPELKRELDHWEKNDSLPYWEAKKAGLLAELGEVSEAEKILEISLKTVREQLNLSPVVDDYSLVSQEAYILQLLKYVKDSISWTKKNSNLVKPLDEEFSKRWNTLLQFKCDPWGELKIFNMFLENLPKDFKRIEKKNGFDIGYISTIEHFGYDPYAQKSYMFLRYVEEIGMPFRISIVTFGFKAAQNAIPYIANYSPSWAFSSYMRLGETKGIDLIFGRKALSKMSVEMSNKLIRNYLRILDKSKKEIINSDTDNNRNFAFFLSSVIPEVFSRLCVKSSYNVKMKLLDFVEYVFNSDYKNRFKGIRSLSERLVKSLSLKEQFEIIPRLVKFPILQKTNLVDSKEFIDPFAFIDSDLSKVVKRINLKIDASSIDKLFKFAKTTKKQRQDALCRLVRLYELNLLNKKQSDLLGKVLWSQCDEKTGFPFDTNFYNFVFLRLPFPKSKEPSKLLRSYLKNSKLPIQSNSNEKKIFISHGIFPIFFDLLGTTNKDIDYTWYEEDISILAEKLKIWWDCDKHYLLKQEKDGSFGPIQNEFKSRFRNLKKVLASVIAPNFKLLDEVNKKSIMSIVNELSDYNMQSLEVETAYYEYLNKEELKRKLQNNLYSYSKLKVVDALQGVLLYLKNGFSNPVSLITAICDNIKCLNETDLPRNLFVIETVIRDYDNVLTSTHLESLKIGLTNLLQKTKIESNDTKVETDYKLKIKAANLSLTLKKYFEKNKKDIPDYISDWKENCLDKNEFSEIRRIWKDE